MIRMILVEELLDAGYEVQDAETGDAAVNLLERVSPEIEVLVTDIHMPGTHDGLELASHFRTRFPDAPIIYTTGRPDALRHLNKLDDRQVLVRKPYVPSQIIERIRGLLEA